MANRDARKLRAIRVAEYALGQRLDRIDWEEDVLNPELDALTGRSRPAELPPAKIVDIKKDGK